ncbi:hypothetical protein BBK36DRAFT_1177345 [Trichoderma citrinoviride]|uniref:Uncharacterized protein n=1 Tax=Trichoderma citrinoviride TaxID=58853 RepID=A0A2T4B5Z2_9HYPO|nr:hypothetical protein BBK36DRAFT_1177345 [Trichoderma citrinoviride]PTB64757.1 hypothetical protein BBK36DRAFT_1177345 [Trichoderma citrinoviride]
MTTDPMHAGWGLSRKLQVKFRTSTPYNRMRDGWEATIGEDDPHPADSHNARGPPSAHEYLASVAGSMRPTTHNPYTTHSRAIIRGLFHLLLCGSPELAVTVAFLPEVTFFPHGMLIEISARHTTFKHEHHEALQGAYKYALVTGRHGFNKGMLK